MDAIILAGGQSRWLGRDKAWEPLSFFNLNTPADLSRAQALLAQPVTLPAASR